MADAKTYTGSCHCGNVRYRVSTDLSKVMQCNCSICSKAGYLLTFVPAEKFKLVSGEENLSDYRFHKKKIRHLFCKTCGVETFGRRVKPEPGKDTLAVNVRCLKGVELKDLNLKFYDGRKL